MKSREEVESELPSLLLDYDAGVRSWIVVPLLYQDKVIGGLHVRSFRPDAYSERDLKLAESIGSQIAGAIANAQILSELIAAQQSLRENEAKFRDFFSTMPDYGYMVSPDGKIINVNDSALKILGYDRDELIGKPLSTIYSPESIKIMKQNFQEWKRSGRLSNVETTIVSKTGQKRTVLLNVGSARNSDGDIVYSTSVQTDITSRKQAEEALRKSEEQYRLIVDTTSEGIWTLDENFVITYANKTMAHMLGYEIDELIGKSVSSLTFEEDIPELLERLGRRRQGVSERFERRFRRKDGGTLWAQVSSTTMADENNSFRGSFAMVSDITSRNMTEQKLAHSYELMRYVIENARSCIAVHDRDLKYIYVSQRYLREYGVKDKDVIGKHHYEVFPDLPQKWRDVHQKALAGEVSSADDDPYVREDGSVDWTQWECRPWYEGDGSVGGFIIYTEIINERRRKEEALRKSEERYRLIVDTTSEGIWTLGEDFVITYANRRIAEMLGYEPDEIIGKDIRSFAFEEDIPALMEGRRRRRQGISEHFERKLCKKDGATLWVHVSATPIVDEQGRFLGAFAMFTDITSRKQAEEEKVLLEAQLRQSQKMEAIGTLAGGVAHDFNNILMAIIGFASMIQMDLDKNDRKNAYVDQILASAERAANLTQSLLAFSRKQKIELKPVRINDIVEQTTKLLKRLLTEDIALKVKLDDRNPVILGDVTQIDQILMNLVTNARDAMPKGGSLRLETGIVNLDGDFMKLYNFGQPGEYALLAVSDAGVGMDDKTKEHIFEPFFTTKEVGKGTGLGLATVYGIVKQHEGYIAVDSTLSKGTTFRIYFPVVRSEKVEAPLKPSEVQRGSETLLVAEDDRAVRKMLVDILRRYGYSMIEAADGQDALRKFIDNKDNIDLIIIDVVMPKMNGKEVYEEIRRTNPNIRVLFISGYTRDVVIDRGVEDTTVDFIKKPLLPQELLRKVREVLDR